MNVCPICGSDSFSYLYLSMGREIVGCTDCMNLLEPWEVPDDEDEEPDREIGEE